MLEYFVWEFRKELTKFATLMLNSLRIRFRVSTNLSIKNSITKVKHLYTFSQSNLMRNPLRLIMLNLIENNLFIFEFKK
jgi:hypothetical protein